MFLPGDRIREKGSFRTEHVGIVRSLDLRPACLRPWDVRYDDGCRRSLPDTKEIEDEYLEHEYIPYG